MAIRRTDALAIANRHKSSSKPAMMRRRIPDYTLPTISRGRPTHQHTVDRPCDPVCLPSLDRSPEEAQLPPEADVEQVSADKVEARSLRAAAGFGAFFLHASLAALWPLTAADVAVAAPPHDAAAVPIGAAAAAGAWQLTVERFAPPCGRDEDGRSLSFVCDAPRVDRERLRATEQWLAESGRAADTEDGGAAERRLRAPVCCC